MFYYHHNILCVEANWMFGEGKILTVNNYKVLTQRQHIEVVRRGCNGTTALVKYDSLPSRFKQMIVKKVGDPYQECKPTAFGDFLEQDIPAARFFHDYTYDTDKPLPLKTQKEYSANAAILNAIGKILKNRTSRTKALGGNTTKLWQRLAEVIAELPVHMWPHTLPSNHKRLKAKYTQYVEEGYAALVHGGFGNKNSEKINDGAKLWVLNRWADRIDKVVTIMQLFYEYNAIAETNEWKPLKSEKAIYNYLNEEHVKDQWFGHRYGELKAKERSGYQIKTRMASQRDMLWYSDGTKLNYYYIDENGKIATCQVYEVMDAFSEVFLGYHISNTEDFEAQYYAYKMAAQVAGHRPYEIKFDNQGGHKKLEAGNFLSRLSRLAIRTQPYNGKSKSIESAFGRFQQQYLKRDWFFTGQNIQAKKEESKANMEFIMENKHMLPTLEQIKAIYKERREQWNSALHHEYKKPRLEVYLESKNERAPEIGIMEMVDLFWIERPVPIMLNASGITFREKKEQHSFMVYTTYDGRKVPDVRWLKQNMDKKFVVKFDPADMTEVYLYEQIPLGLRFAKRAEMVLETHRAIQEQESWESQYYRDIKAENEAARIETRDKMNEILALHNATAEQRGFTEPRLKGIETSKKASSLGQHQKVLSNAAETDDEGQSIYDLY